MFCDWLLQYEVIQYEVEVNGQGNIQSIWDEEWMVEDEFIDMGSICVIYLYCSNQCWVGWQNEQIRYCSERSNSGQWRNVQCQSYRYQCFCGCSLRVQQSRSKEEDDGQQLWMILNYFISGIFDLVDVVGNESIVQLCNIQDINIGVYICFEGVGVEDVVGIDFIDNGGQSCNVEYDDQDCVGGVYQWFFNQIYVWVVDDCIDNYVNYVQQEQLDGCFCIGFDFNLFFIVQFNQVFFQMFVINWIVREFGVEQYSDQKGYYQNCQQGGWDDYGEQMEVVDVMIFYYGRYVNYCC